MRTKQAPRRNHIIYVVLALATIAVYQQVRGFGFVFIDDFLYASKNPRVLGGLSLDSLRWAFTTNFSANWHPLTWISLMADAQFARWLLPGFAKNPSAVIFHATNVLLHVANTLLLFAVLFSMTGARWRSAFVAALFALHPLHVESVAWVSERKDVLSTMFWMLTMLSYAAYAKGRDRMGEGLDATRRAPSVTSSSESFAPTRTRLRALYVLTLALFALGLMAKPMLVSLPIILLLLDYWPLRRGQGTGNREQEATDTRHPSPVACLLEKLPFFALAGASCVVTLWAQNASGAVIHLSDATVGQRLANAAVSTMSYIGKAISPMNLAMFYPHPGPDIPTWSVIASAAAILLICAAAIACARRYPVVTVGWFWYLITLIPVIGIVQVGSQGMADRYTYVPLIGVFIAATWLVADGFGRAQARFSTFLLSNAAGAALATVLLIGLAVTSHYQVGYWRNTTTLARHAASVTENNHYAHAVLGFALLKAGKTEEALEHCVEAVRLEPAFSEGHYRLGLVLAEKGLMTGAVTHLRMALRADPDNPDIYNDLGCALGRIGQPEEAIEAFATALRLRPDHDAAARNLKATRSATDTPGRLE